MWLQVVKKGGKRVRNVYVGEPVLGGPYAHSSEVRYSPTFANFVHIDLTPQDSQVHRVSLSV
jgi:hypothetical protein